MNGSYDCDTQPLVRPARSHRPDIVSTYVGALGGGDDIGNALTEAELSAE